MKKILFILSILLFASFVEAQTGIGTTAPMNKFEVVTTSADPAISGSSANGNLRLGPSTGVHVLDFGLSSTATYAWLQARSKSAYGTTYNIAINPNGGNVGIGTNNPTAKLIFQIIIGCLLFIVIFMAVSYGYSYIVNGQAKMPNVVEQFKVGSE
jgi:hypothetical protein